jgi:hypothetical protein
MPSGPELQRQPLLESMDPIRHNSLLFLSAPMHGFGSGDHPADQEEVRNGREVAEHLLGLAGGTMWCETVLVGTRYVLRTCAGTV